MTPPYRDRLEDWFSLSRLLLGGLLLLAVLPLTCSSGRTADGIEITIWTSFDVPAEAQLFHEQIRAFEQIHPTIQVKVEQIGASRRTQKYLAAMQANACGDIVILHWKHVPMFAAKGMLVPLEPYITAGNYDVEDFFPAALDAYRFDGQQVALPEKGSTQLLFYNKDLFDAAGVPYPDDRWTFDDLVAAGLELVEPHEGHAPPIAILPLDAASWIWSMGGRFANDGLTSLHFTDPATVRGVEFLWSLRHTWGITSRNLNALGIDAAEVDVFEKGGVAMAVGGPWHFPKYEAITDFDWDIALFPQGPGGRKTRFAAMGYGIWSGSPFPEASWKLISFLLDQQRMSERRSAGYTDIPARRSVAHGPFAQQEAPFDMSVLLRSMDPDHADVQVFPKHEQWALLERYFIEEFDRAMLQQVTPAQAMQRVQDRATLTLSADRYEPGVADYVGVAGVPALLLTGWACHHYRRRRMAEEAAA